MGLSSVSDHWLVHTTTKLPSSATATEGWCWPARCEGVDLELRTCRRRGQRPRRRESEAGQERPQQGAPQRALPLEPLEVGAEEGVLGLELEGALEGGDGTRAVAHQVRHVRAIVRDAREARRHALGL